MARLPLFEVAEENFRRADRRCLALDVTRAVSECRVSWDVERKLRSLNAVEARVMFDLMAVEVGNGASFNRVAAWLVANVN